jgi:hypothetical protein
MIKMNMKFPADPFKVKLKASVSTNKAIMLQVINQVISLISKFSKGVDDDTKDDVE